MQLFEKCFNMFFTSQTLESCSYLNSLDEAGCVERRTNGPAEAATKERKSKDFKLEFLQVDVSFTNANIANEWKKVQYLKMSEAIRDSLV